MGGLKKLLGGLAFRRLGRPIDPLGDSTDRKTVSNSQGEEKQRFAAAQTKALAMPDQCFIFGKCHFYRKLGQIGACK